MKTNGAMCAKTKAIFANRLKEHDYNNLLAKKNMTEIVMYLKNDTYFAGCLDGINEKAIRRGQLEILIRNELLYRISKILKFASDIENSIYKFFILQSEIHLITTIVRSYYDEEVVSFSKLPILIEHQLSFDLKTVANTKNYDELLQSLKGNTYYNILLKYQSRSFDEFNFVALEYDLYNSYYTRVLEILDKYPNDKSKIIKDIFNAEIELNNIAKIYRLKKYFKSTIEQIRALTFPFYHRFNKDEFEDFLKIEDAEMIIEKLKKSNYRFFLDKEIYDDNIESVINRIMYNINKKQMFFSNDSDVVVTVYFTLAKTEIQNIVDIIEGVRYGINSDIIKKMLIF